MPDAAVIFDVDGVLLELTRAEEDAFFEPFAELFGLTGLSRDWDSYRIRNDEDIIAEILEAYDLAPGERPAVIANYMAALARNLAPVEIPGARELLAGLAGLARLGIATANMREAARLRLHHLGLWAPVAAHAFGADGGGHKRDILARAIAALAVPTSRIVYVGDNRNDVEAGLANGVHFIGFATEDPRRRRLAAAGATHLSGDHHTTRRLIGELLS